MRYRRATEQVWRRNRARKSGPRDRRVTGAERLLALTGTNGVSLKILGVTDWVTRCTRIYDCAQNRVRSATAGTKERNRPGGACPEYWIASKGISGCQNKPVESQGCRGALRIVPPRRVCRGALNGAGRDFSGPTAAYFRCPSVRSRLFSSQEYSISSCPCGIRQNVRVFFQGCV